VGNPNLTFSKRKITPCFREGLCIEAKNCIVATSIFNLLQGVKQCSSVESAACGSIAGAIAAGLTTPLDVAKTRIMLETGQRSSIASMLLKIARNESPAKLFAGIYPRMCYLSLGAFVFFFAYEFTLNISYTLF
jgi:hypothetical protein